MIELAETTNGSGSPPSKVGIEPAVLYMGTPVVLITTMNEDGSVNVAPMSSAWWLGWSCMLGLDASSKTVENLVREGECVLNLPTAAEVDHVDRLARVTGSDPVPRHKKRLGFRHEKRKLEAAGLTPEASFQVRSPRLAECPVQMEARMVQMSPFAANDPKFLVDAVAVEMRIVRVHAAPEVLSDEYENRIEPTRWRPLLMSFLRYFSMGGEVSPSRLADVPEEAWGDRRPVKRRGSADPFKVQIDDCS